MTAVLKATFIDLISKNIEPTPLAVEFWEEIEHSYSDRKRHYHTLQHLENLLNQLTSVRDVLQNWNTILFSIYYHDIIYNPLKSNNEEKSADLAAKRMRQICVSEKTIADCRSQILATGKHQKSADADTNYFIDADLSILGGSWGVYENYYKNVRREYSIYPDLIFNPGRKKVLKHYLAMERIFSTDFFHSKFESQARFNIKREIELL